MTVGTYVHSVGGPHASLVTAVSVTVPTIADAEVDEVEVDVSSSGFDFTLGLGDLIVAGESAALPTSCTYHGAHVTDTDKITFSFGALEGGSGVTGAAVLFTVLALDVTP